VQRKAPQSSRPLVRRALQIEQSPTGLLYLFSLTAREILEFADISRVARDKGGRLIGYQRPEVKRHIQEIVDYLNGKDVVFANSIILALEPGVKFTRSRGPRTSDGLASAGLLQIPRRAGQRKPAWIVDGQQRAVALARADKPNLPVPITAFVAESLELQRDQFLRINNTRPLPRGLVTELLPDVGTLLPSRLAARKVPSALCELLNTQRGSPFRGLIRRASSTKESRSRAVIADTSVVDMIHESLSSTAGCLFPYRNLATGQTDMDGMLRVLVAYWTAVRETFPDAWGVPPSKSRLMHGVGIRAVGRLMDKIMSGVNPQDRTASRQAVRDLRLVAPACHWTDGEWSELGLTWNELQNVPRHIRALSNFLIRSYVDARIRR
jgi:DGQHR domain-containing protein